MTEVTIPAAPAVSTDNNNANNNNNNLLPFHVDVTLSRPTYRVGGTIVGTLRLTPLPPVVVVEEENSNNNNKNKNTKQQQQQQQQQTYNDDDDMESPEIPENACTRSIDPMNNTGKKMQDTATRAAITTSSSSSLPPAQIIIRDSMASLYLFCVGYCRFDPRWHHVDDHLLQFDKCYENGTIVVRRNNNNSNQNNSNDNDHHDDDDDGDLGGIPVDLPVPPSHTVPVWASYPVRNLMKIPERTIGRWNDAKPKPIRLRQRHQHHRHNNNSSTNKQERSQEQNNNEQEVHDRDTNDDDVNDDDDVVRLEDHHVAYTFRIDLPKDIPPTTVTASCRHYYTIVIKIQLKKGIIYHNEPFWFHIPVTILTSLRSNNNNTNINTSLTTTLTTNHDDDAIDEDVPAVAGRQRISCEQVMAHSSGLSCSLTATELHQGGGGGQYTVNRNGAALYRHWQGASRYYHQNNVQSMSVVDPHTGKPVCILTMIGLTVLNPGSRAVLKFDFPSPYNKRKKKIDTRRVHDEVDDMPEKQQKSWLLCYQVSACLQTEEMAIQLSKSINTSQKTKRLARKHLFASAYNRIDPMCVESTSLDLLLPDSAPCTVQTDAVEVSTKCIVDIAIADNEWETTPINKKHKDHHQQQGGGGKKKFRNLHLEIPCQVVHPIAAWEWEDDDPDGGSPAPATTTSRIQHHPKNHTIDLYDQFLAERRQEQEERLQQQQGHDSKSNDNNLFYTKDIMDDLKILSLTMADKCDIRPKPSPSNQW